MTGSHQRPPSSFILPMVRLGWTSAWVPTSQHKGAAGEHYAAMRLSMLGVDTGLVPAKTATTDLLVHLAGATASIQVKASQHPEAKPVPVDMRPAKVALTDFLVVVLLGLGTTQVCPVAYVLPRQAAVEWCELYNDNHPGRPVTRMNLESRAYLERYREAWHLVAEHLIVIISSRAQASDRSR